MIKKGQCDKHGAYYYVLKNQGCGNCKGGGNSYMEMILLNMVNGLIPCESGVRDIIPPKEIDIYIPEKRIGIEFNGFEFHSENKGLWTRTQDKVVKCMDQNVLLLTIWQDSLKNNPVKVKDLILFHLGRLPFVKAEVERVTPRRAKQFYDQYSFRYYKPSTYEESFGLFHGNKMVMCMSYQERENRIVKIARKTGVAVKDGAFQLISYLPAGETYIYYMDLSSMAQIDLADLADKQDLIGPGYQWYRRKESKILASNQVCKHKLYTRFPEYDGETPSTWLRENGWVRVPDAGRLKLTFNM